MLEAAASGVPVVTTLATGSRDSVIPEVTGLLIPPGYPEAISEAVLKLLGDPERLAKMGQAARIWISRHYANDLVLGMAVSFYERILSPAPAVAEPVAGRASERETAATWLFPRA